MGGLGWYYIVLFCVEVEGGWKVEGAAVEMVDPLMSESGDSSV